MAVLWDAKDTGSNESFDQVSDERHVFEIVDEDWDLRVTSPNMDGFRSAWNNSNLDPIMCKYTGTSCSDTMPPDTNIVTGPTGTITTNSASFTWSGTDTVTPTASLVYAYRLDPLEASFSVFGSATSKSYTGLTNRSYTFLVKAKDEAGNEDLSPASRSFTVNESEAGLQGEYFDNADLTNPKLTRVDPTIDFVYGRSAPPDTLLGTDTFSIRWTGKLRTEVTETYTFELETDDGVRLWLDGHLVVDHWQTGRAVNVGTMDLTAGLHDIKLEFFEEIDEALARLKWSSPSMPNRVIVPQDHLAPPEAVGTAPQLAWTEEAGYCANGLEPEIGNTHTSFTYRVKYTDADGDAPMVGYPRVHILQGGKEISGSPFAMVLASGTPTAGAIYTYTTTTLPMGKDYTYYFDAKDATGLQAVATPITPTPVVALNAPSVSAAPTLALRLNQCAFRSGHTLTLTVSVTPGDTPQVVDVYVAALLPDGSLLFLGSGTTSPRPIVTGWTIVPVAGEIVRYTFGGGEPRGSYTWLGAFTVPGTLNLIGEIAQAPFTFRP